MNAAGELSIEEAAGRLGVHYMTVYRYVRLGRLPAEHRDGRWHIRPEDLEPLRGGARRARGTGDPPAAARADHRGGADDADSVSGRLADRLVAGDVNGAWSIVEGALLAGAPATVYTEILAPALRSLGEGWESGRLSVAEEHRATALALGIVGRLGPLFRRRGRRRPGQVLLAGVEGDSHVIPLMMVADMLRAGGFEVVHLGADVPVSTLVPFAAVTPQLRAIGLSASTDASAVRAAGVIAALRERVGDLPIVLGGPAVGSEAAARSAGADGWARDAAGALELITTLAGAR